MNPENDMPKEILRKSTITNRGRITNSILSVQNSTAYLICMLPTSMLVQSFPGFGLINILLVGLLLFCMFLCLTKQKLAHGFWILICGILFITIYEVGITPNPLYESNSPAYLLLWVIFLAYVFYSSRELYGSLRRNIVFVKNAIAVWNVLVLISAFLPSSYSAGWGEGVFFTSFTDSVFRLEQAAFCVAVLDILYLTITRNRQLAIAFMILPLYCAFMGGSRTYFAIISIVFLIFLKELGWSRRRYAAICGIAVALVVVVALNTSIGDKFLAQLQPSNMGHDLLHQFTNGRSEFWSIDLLFYANQPFANQLFGSGFNCIYDVNRTYYGTAIYAHNDYINLLVTYGVFGLVLYLIPVISLVRSIHVNRGCTFAFAFVSVWVINAFFNMNYTYMCATVALGLLFTVLHESGNQ